MVESFLVNGYNACMILDSYLTVYLRDRYLITINYNQEVGQTLAFQEKTAEECDEIYDIFPPLMFCKAANDQSRKFVCHASYIYRKGITADHPFVKWLLDNSVQLNRYFQRQFRQILKSLYKENAEEIIEVCSAVRRQLLSLTDRHGVNVSMMPLLSRDDFWMIEEEDES